MEYNIRDIRNIQDLSDININSDWYGVKWNLKCKKYIKYDLLNLIGTESNGRASPSTLSKEFGWWCISPEINPTVQKVFKKINHNFFKQLELFQKFSNICQIHQISPLRNSCPSGALLYWGGVV